MPSLFKTMLLALCLLAAPAAYAAQPAQPAPLPGQPDFESGSGLVYDDLRANMPLAVEPGGEATYNGQRVVSRTVTKFDQGMAIPDGAGGVVVAPGKNRQPANPNYVNARELKLKVRELADQLIGGLRDQSLSGVVALPTSFVMQDDFERTSSFGRFIAELLYYEFNQRGFPVREYRLDNKISVRDDGEFLLSRAVGSLPTVSGQVYVIGTYYTDGTTIFVNSRLIRKDGAVLRSANLVLESNALTRRMLANSGKKIKSGSLEIKSFESTRPQVSADPVDSGLDIH